MIQLKNINSQQDSREIKEYSNEICSVFPTELIQHIFSYIDENRDNCDNKILYSCIQVNKGWYNALMNSAIGTEKLWLRNHRKFGYGYLIEVGTGRLLKYDETITWKESFECAEKQQSQKGLYLLKAKLIYVGEKLAKNYFEYPYLLSGVINIGTVLSLGGCYWGYQHFFGTPVSGFEALSTITKFEPFILPGSIALYNLGCREFESFQSRFLFAPRYESWHKIFRYIRIDIGNPPEEIKNILENVKEQEKEFCKKTSCNIL